MYLLSHKTVIVEYPQIDEHVYNDNQLVISECSKSQFTDLEPELICSIKHSRIFMFNSVLRDVMLHRQYELISDPPFPSITVMWPLFANISVCWCFLQICTAYDPSFLSWFISSANQRWIHEGDQTVAYSFNPWSSNAKTMLSQQWGLVMMEVFRHASLEFSDPQPLSNTYHRTPG